jgi:signal transduction histidine kinase
MAANQTYFLILHGGTLLLFIVLHALRSTITLGPTLAIAALYTFLVWQVAQAGWWVEIGALNVNAAHLGVIPAIVMGGVLIYAMDGVKLGHAYAVVVLGAALFATFYVQFLDSLNGVVPLPNFIFQSLQSQIALAVALTAGVIAAMAAYEAGRRLVPWWLALSLSNAVGLVTVLAVTSYASYGPRLGLVNLRNELPEYAVAVLLPMAVTLAYGGIAAGRGWIMPARPLRRLFSVWQSTEEEVRQALHSALEAHHTIAELRDLNAALEQEQKLRAHQVESSPLAVLEIDSRGLVTVSNHAARKLFQDSRPLTHRMPVERLLPGFLKIFGDGTRMSGVLPITTRTGERRSLDVTVMPLHNGTGDGWLGQRRAFGFSVLLEDVTECERARVHDQIVSRMRGVHMASRVVAHDFSNLMTATEGSIASIRAHIGQGAYEQIEPLLQAIHHAMGQARGMLRQLGAREGFEQPDIRVHDLRDLVREATNIERPNAEKAGLDLIVHDLPSVLAEVDGTQIVRVLINLLRNAVRATPPGGRVEVAIETVAEKVRLVVRDSGAGMSAEALRQAFQPGFSSKGKGKGGLGLPISYLIVDAHGGRLDLESRPGQGTRATVLLNRAVASVASAGGAAQELQDLRVLVLVRDGAHRERLADALVETGASVDEIESLDELAAWISEEGAAWDVVVRDTTFPTAAMDGLAAACMVLLPEGDQPPRVHRPTGCRLEAPRLDRLVAVVGDFSVEGL